MKPTTSKKTAAKKAAKPKPPERISPHFQRGFNLLAPLPPSPRDCALTLIDRAFEHGEFWIQKEKQFKGSKRKKRRRWRRSEEYRRAAALLRNARRAAPRDKLVDAAATYLVIRMRDRLIEAGSAIE